MDEFELVRGMRIDFKLIPIEGSVTYPFSLEGEIRRKVTKFLGKDGDKNVDVGVKICPRECRFAMLSCRKFTGEEYDRHLRDGDHGFVIIHWGGLGFVDRYPGDDWDRKFQTARRSLMHHLNSTLCNLRRHLLVTFLHPSQDARVFINLVSSLSPSPPSLLLQGLPCGWFGPQQRPSLLNFLHSLAKIRDLEITKHYYVCIQFKNYKQCYKALKKLCSHSLKKNGQNDVVDYLLTLKDDSLVSIAFDEALAYKCNSYKAYNQSATTQALNNRVLMLQEEFNLVKILTENSKDLKGSSKARALNHRVAMIGKRLDIVKSVMEEFGTGYNESPSSQALRNRVSMLDKELSTMKVVLEDASIDRIQALEIRMAMLEEELKTMKDDVIEESNDRHESPTDQALKRCKRLRRD